MQKVLDYIENNRQAFLDTLFEGLRIPSISAKPEHKDDMLRMANWLANLLSTELKFDSCLIPTSGNPLVYAESPQIPDAPTVLIYGHYDVQPPEPLELWHNKKGPFEPEIRDGKIYCRGADDDKGQSLTHLFAAKAWLETHGRLPVQLKFIFDGEEEINSGGLSGYLLTPDAKTRLAADVILVSDTEMIGPDMPAICYGLRGVQPFELTLTGPNRDVHSGHYGGSIANPAVILAKILSSFIDDNGIIQIPGFYDGIIEPDEKERRILDERIFNEQESLAEIGVKASWGDPAYSARERREIRPAFDINGLTAGYQGKGGKTIIPSVASAKFTFRLVPNQNVDAIYKSVESFIRKQLPEGLDMQLTECEGSCGMVVPIDSPYMVPAAKTLEKTFGNKTLFIREGGSIPIVAEIRNVLGADLLLIGYGLSDDAIHSPDEKFALDNFYKGIANNACLLEELAKVKSVHGSK